MQINLKYSIHAGNKYNTELLEKEEGGGVAIQDTGINPGYRDQFRMQRSQRIQRSI